MNPNCHVAQVPSTLLAVAEAEVPRGRVSQHIRGLFDLVYEWKKSVGAKQTGHNYVVYEPGAGDGLLVRAGFPVSEPFASSDSVKCFELPAGDAAHLMHVGPYTNFGLSYGKLHAWCAENALAMTAQSWEVYGDWSEDESKLETGLYLRLSGA